jgi:NhaP-type Na+/H+ and K+/H+ antiporter
MAPLITLIVIFTLSILITKIATEALIHTGLSKEAAKFQARSAFTGVGYTTDEAENIVQHPVRRRIILSLMFIGNVGIISAIASLMLTFINSNEGDMADYWRILIIAGSMLVLWLLSKSKFIERLVVKLINRALEKFTNLNVRDYVELLELTNEYEITVLKVNQGDWLENKELKTLNLRKEGINLIGIRRKNGKYIGTPHGETTIQTGDNLIIYGREKTLKNLEKRKENYQAREEHDKAVKDQEKELEKQEDR